VGDLKEEILDNLDYLKSREQISENVYISVEEYFLVY
jgi:hypothetical protein